MGLQAGLWTEMRVRVNIKQELPVRVETHQLQRLGIKESLGNTEILIFTGIAVDWPLLDFRPDFRLKCESVFKPNRYG
jgi:hypothetical protein